MPCGSNPLIGSSNTKKSGLPTKAKAIPSRCFIPSEKCFVFLRPACTRPTNSNNSSAYFLSRIPNNSALIIRLSCADIFGYNPGCSIRHPTLDRTFANDFPEQPNISYSPAVGSANPAIIFKTVVLPAPFLPINPYIAPRRMCISTWSTATCLPNCFVKPLVFNNISLLPSLIFILSVLSLVLHRLS